MINVHYELAYGEKANKRGKRDKHTLGPGI